MPSLICPRVCVCVLYRLHVYTEQDGEIEKEKIEREIEESPRYYTLVAVSTRCRRIKGKAAVTLTGEVRWDGVSLRRGRGVKSWSRFTSYHLRISCLLPLALATVALVKENACTDIIMVCQNTILPSPVRTYLRPGQTQRGSLFLSLFRLDYIGKNVWNGSWGEGCIEFLLMRLAGDLKKEKALSKRVFLVVYVSRRDCGDERLEGLQGIASVLLIRIRARSFVFKRCKHGDVFRNRWTFPRRGDRKEGLSSFSLFELLFPPLLTNESQIDFKWRFIMETTMT